MIETDIIGALFDPPSGEGGEPILLDGWHVNITPVGQAQRPDLEAFLVTPGRLRRVWSGDDAAQPVLTVALRFADEAQARVLNAGGD